MAKGSFAGRLAIDVGVWLAICAGFLAVYVSRFAVPASAILPHVRVIATVWLAVALVRVIAGMLAGRRWALLASSLAIASALTILVLYYAMVIIGLNSWGRVISWDLIRTYAVQLPALADALGISLVYAGVALAAAFGAVMFATWHYLRRCDWTGLLRDRLSGSVVAIVSGAAAAIVGVEAYAFVVAPPVQQHEPLSMTLFPASEATGRMQVQHGHQARMDALQREEDAARASYAPTADAVRRNVVLIVVDALRADHMGVLGYARDTTPNLAALARGRPNVALTTAHTSCGESACGLTSLATSRYLHQFPSRPISLTEVLKRNGYAVHMILSGDHVHFYGLRAAYGKVDTYYDGSMAQGRYMNDDHLVLERLESMPAWDGKPAMFQLHLMSAHALGVRESAFRVFGAGSNYSVPGNRPDTGGPANPAAVNFYDDGVRQADAMIGEALRTLQAKGYLSDALVVITGDHGEMLGEHNLYAHANGVYEEVLHVPLIVLPFGYQPRKPIDTHAWASQVDIAPTILAELGIARPSTWQGVALQEDAKPAFTYFREATFAGLYDLRTPGHVWKYYLDVRTLRDNAVDLAVQRERDAGAGVPPPSQAREWRALVLSTLPGDLRAE
jgi:glucan phosphoethanolaminetransferase (alkaline phosphatase superfamily)